MPMNDDSMVKIMSTLGLNYGPAELATKSFEGRIVSLNKQLFDLKANAIAGARNINQAFSSQLGGMGGNSSISNIAAQYAKSNVILDQYGNTLKTVKTNTESLGKSVGVATGAANQHSQSVQNVARQYNVLGNEMQRRASWFITGGLFYGSIRAAKEAVQSISQVEYAVNSISRVMQDATLNTKEYRDTLLQIGIDYGQSFDNVQKVAFTWATAGYNAKDSIDLTKTSMLAMTTAEMDATQATVGLVAIMSQWGLTTKDLLPTLDKINKVADTQVISAGDLITGLAKASATAKQFGLDINQTIAYLSVMKDTTGATGKELGNAFKSILAYTQRSSSLKVFESLGIDVWAKRVNGIGTEFVGVDKIFSQVAAKWKGSSAQIQEGFMKSADEAGLMNEEIAKGLGIQNEWNDVQKRDITTSAAGTYRMTYYKALIANLGGLQKVFEAINNSAGYSEMESAQRMQTLQAKYESLKTAATQLAVSMGDAGLLGMLKGLVSGLTVSAEVFSKLDPHVKGLIINFVLAAAAIKAFKFIGSTLGIDISTNILNMVRSQNLLNSSVKAGTITQVEAKTVQTAWRTGVQASTLSVEAAAVQQKLFGMAAKGTTLALVAQEAVLSLGISVAIMALITVFTGLSNAQAEAKQRAEELSQKLQQESDTLKDLKQQYTDIIKSGDDTTDSKTRLKAIQDQLIKTFGAEVTGIDLANGAYQDQIKILDALSLKKLSDKVKSDQMVVDSYNSEKYDNPKFRGTGTKAMLGFGNANYDIFSGEGFGTQLSVQQYYDSLIELQKKVQQHNKDIFSSQQQIPTNAKEWLNALNAVNSELAKIKPKADAINQLAIDKVLLANSSGTPIPPKTVVETPVIPYTPESLKSLLDSSKITPQKELEELLKIKNSALYSGFDKKTNSQLNEELLSETQSVSDKAKAYLSLLSDIKSVKEQIKQANIKETTSPTSANMPSDIANLQIRDTINELVKSYHTEADITDQKNQSLERQLKIAASQKDYNKELSLSNQLIKGEKQEITDLQNANTKLHAEATRLRNANPKVDTTSWLDSAGNGTIEYENFLNSKATEESAVADKINALNKKKYDNGGKLSKTDQNTLNDLLKQNATLNSQYKLYEDLFKNISALKKAFAANTDEIYRQGDAIDSNTNKITNDYNDKLKDQQQVYKDLLKGQQDAFKDAYDNRIDLIEKEANEQKEKQQAIIDGIDDVEKAHDRIEKAHDYNQKMGDLQKDLAYWQVRTSTEASQKVLDIQKQIDEEKHDNDVELTKQGLDDKKEAAQKEIDNIDATAKKEKAKWELAYKNLEKAFSDHNLDLISQAASTSKNAYKQWVDNYITPMQNALKSGDTDAFGKAATDAESSLKKSKIYNLASSIVDLKKRAESGDATAFQEAKSIYSQLEALSAKDAVQLHKMNYQQSVEYLSHLPKAHGGGETFSYGAVYMRPGELIFPPTLSTDLKSLISVISGGSVNRVQSSTTTMDNSKKTEIKEVLHVDNMYLGDDVDSDILSRQLGRVVSSLK